MLYIFLTYILTKLGFLCFIFGLIGIILFCLGIVAYFCCYYDGLNCSHQDTDKRMAKVLRIYLKRYFWIIVIVFGLGLISPSSNESKIVYAYIALKAGTETEMGKEAIEASKLYLKSLQKEFSDKAVPKNNRTKN